MKRIVAFIFTLFLLLVMYGRANAGGDPSPNKKNRKEEVMNIATSILNAIHDYKYEERSECITALRDKLDFDLIKDITHQVPKNCTVDSLVVGNDQLARWGYFKSVDLQYIKDVEAVVTLKTEFSKDIARAIAGMLKREGLDTSSEAPGEYVFKDTVGGFVIDKRFKEDVKSRVASRYNYTIQVMDDYLILDTESVGLSFYIII